MRDDAGVGVGAVGREGAESGAGVAAEGVGGMVWTVGWWEGVSVCCVSWVGGLEDVVSCAVFGVWRKSKGKNSCLLLILRLNLPFLRLRIARWVLVVVVASGRL